MKILNISKLVILSILLFIINVNAQDKDISNPVNIVISSYLGLKDALVAGDASVAEAKGKVLLAAIGRVPKTGLKSDENALLSKIEFDSRHISEVDNISHQREHFASLSNNLYTFLKVVKVNNTVLYRQYCTMNKRYFLSESDKGKDPYMGMANCSKVTKTLPVSKK